MLLARSALVVLAGAYVAAPTDPLRVMRASPRDVADQNAVVLVTFDRPIAAGVESAVDPQTIFRIEPRVNGRLDWRDPVTLRFRPTVALPVGRTFTITIANTFQALDGSRLEQPYTLTFRVQGPRVADAWPVNQWTSPKHIAPDARFLLLVESPVDLRLVEALVTIDAGPCGAGSIRVRAERQRRIVERDPRWGWYRRVGTDTLADQKRVVELVPAQPLPRNCAARLGVPERLDAGATPRWWNFHTYGPPGVNKVECGFGSNRQRCPIGPVVVEFASPVRGAEVLAHVSLVPAVPLSVRDTGDESDRWILDGELKPRTRYTVVIDSTLTDVFGQRLGARVVKNITTTPYTPTVRYPYGRMVVERNGPRTLAAQHVNIDTLDLIIAGVPDSLEAQALARSWGWEDLWSRVLPAATHQRIPVTGLPDVPRVTAVRLPTSNAARPGSATLLAVKIASGQSDPDDQFKPVALIQVTDLAVHARIGTEEGVVWVTGVGDGKPRAGAKVTLHDPKGKQRATAVTDARGLARLSGFAPPDTTGPVSSEDCEYCGSGDGFEGYVAASLGTDRALLGISQYDPDLSPWQFNVSSAWGDQRRPSAATVFTERGIYRPGEPVYAKAIVRRGPLGALAVPRGDSLRWRFLGRDDAVLKDTIVALSPFGTSAVTFPLGPDVPLGEYRVVVQTKRDGRWGRAADTWYRIAEYRPPEFLVSVAAAKTPRFAGDSLGATVEARYLFGAPMARASVTWFARQRTAWSWEYEIPNTDGFTLGETGWWWEEDESGNRSGQVLQSGTDTLDGTGRLRLALAAPPPPKGRPAWTTFEATVVDVNRQSVGASAAMLVHPAAVYLGAKPEGTEYFWQAAKPRTVGVIAVTPDGRRVPGVAVRGTLIRREWHQVRRTREGYAEDVGEWVADTIARCSVTTAAQPAPCIVTPPAGGSYTMRFTATDAAGRPAVTSFHRWVVGSNWVPWNDDGKFKMDVVPDKTRYTVGDTATVLFASPFTNAEAWITVEREGIIDQRRLRLTSGTTTLRLPVTEAYAPNAFVSIVVVRGRSAPPAAPDDPGRPTLRVGYAELRVTPEVKRLNVDVQPVQAEYRPGDSARVRLRVRDARGAGGGRRAEVTLWAVDEGVLALTGYKTPDPVDLLYKRRGLGMRLGSTLVAVAAQVVEGEKGQRAPGGGGGMDVEGILRSRFQTTAFFLGSVVTDSAGRAVAAAKLPDNLTTFRVMAVAVTAGDRYGSGESPLLVTRPLLARPALPRFVREDDRFNAGVVVNQRLGGTPRVLVEARGTGVTLVDSAAKTVTLEAGRGREVRFGFRGVPGDSATYRFKVSSGTEADAVETRVPIRPVFHPRAFAAAGVLADTASVDFTFPEALDPARSRVELSFGTTTLAIVRGYQRNLEIYPYYCTEQISSIALPLIALYQAEKQLGGAPVLRGDPRRQIEDAVAILSRRQRDDGAIGMWSNRDWSNAWLSAHAGRALLSARTAGIVVNDTVLTRLADYLTRYLRSEPVVFIPVAYWYDDPRVRLSDRTAAVDFLSRLGRPDVAAENALLGLSAQLAWEDRVLLAEIVARRRQLDAARALLEPTWRQVKIEGRRATLPEEADRRFYFYSSVRGAARLLSATLAVDPNHALVGPLVETVVQRGRVAAHNWWNTQDYSAAVQALLAYERRRRQAGPRPVRLVQAGRTLLQATARGSFTDTSLALSGLLENRPDGKQGLRLRLEGGAAGEPVFFYVTVREVPRVKPVTPFDQGIRVERWYERYDTGTPVTSAAEGDLVRVRLRITVPAQRSFLVVDDALPGGLEAVDLSLRTQGALPPSEQVAEGAQEEGQPHGWSYGYWEYGWWSPFDYRELRDDRVVYVATTLWPGTYTATYVARATTPGVFIRPPAHAEEMYNPAVNGRSDGGVFTVTPK